VSGPSLICSLAEELEKIYFLIPVGLSHPGGEEYVRFSLKENALRPFVRMTVA
jgi:hypothetical protein